RHTSSARDWSSDVCSSDLRRFNMTSLSQFRCSILEHLWRTLFTGAMAVAMTLHAAASSPATAAAAASATDRSTRLSTAQVEQLEIGRASCREREPVAQSAE